MRAEEVKARRDIVEIAGRYTTLKKEGKSFKGLCPFHDENTGSFDVDPQKQTFKCFGCGEQGDVITLVMKAENVDFKTALNKLAGGDSFGNTPRRTTTPDKPRKLTRDEMISHFAKRCLANRAVLLECKTLDTDKPTRGHEWLRDAKGITYETQKARGIGWIDDYHDASRGLQQCVKMEALQAAGVFNHKGHFLAYKHRLIFPWYATYEGAQCPYYLQFRNIDATESHERFLFPVGGCPDYLPALYNFDAIGTARATDQPLILCEGISDTLAAVQAGFYAVGAASNDGLRASDAAHYFRDLSVYIGFDHDHMDAVQKTAEIIAGVGLPAPWILDLPEDKDVNEIVRLSA